MLHNATMEHAEWFDRLPTAPKPTNAAKAARIQPTTLIRQIERGEISANNVILLARAYGANIVQALVDTGYIHSDEVEQIGINEALDIASNREFLDAIWRRTDKDPQSRKLMGLGPKVINPSKDGPTSNVRMIPQPVHPMSDDEISDAVREANELRGAAQERTEELTEPENP